MRLKIRAHRFDWILRSRPSTEVFPLTIPVVGDCPSSLAQNRVEELISAMARLFASTDRPAGALKPATVGDSAILSARMGQDETIRPSRDTVPWSWRGVRRYRPVGEWMKFR
jgi:hypothetical protein